MIRVPVTALLVAVVVLLPSSASGARYRSSVAPLSPALQARLKSGGFWHRGCPVGLSALRVLTVSYRGFDGHSHTGRIVVNARVARPLTGVFARLWGLHFPIRRMGTLPLDGDVTASFSCREASPSPCVGGTGTGSWSMHAFGLAVDLNPGENPYVGCGQSRDPHTRKYFDRSRHRKGMVTPSAIQAFGTIGWGWGGSWAGDTKDYMHFSSNGH